MYYILPLLFLCWTSALFCAGSTEIISNAITAAIAGCPQETRTAASLNNKKGLVIPVVKVRGIYKVELEGRSELIDKKCINNSHGFLDFYKKIFILKGFNDRDQEELVEYEITYGTAPHKTLPLIGAFIVEQKTKRKVLDETTNKFLTLNKYEIKKFTKAAMNLSRQRGGILPDRFCR